MIYLEFLNGTEENISKISLKTKYKIEQNFFFWTAPYSEGEEESSLLSWKSKLIK